MKKLIAGSQFPQIKVTSLSGQTLTLGAPAVGYDWQMVVVYRGKHCPLCSNYLTQLEQLKADFSGLGVDIIAVSADSQSQAKVHINQLNLSLEVAYGLTIKQMQGLGLYLSNPRSEQETDHVFAEPGLFVVNEKGQLQVIDIANGPFVRPELNTLLSGLGFIRNPENHYPIRGTYA